MGRSITKEILTAVFLFCFEAFSQSGLESRLNQQDREREKNQFLSNHADFICSASQFYKVNYGTLLYILDYQLKSYDEREHNQKYDRSLKNTMSNRIELEETYKKNTNEDFKRAMNCDLNRKRSSISSGDDYFASLGPAQIQVYVATMIYEKTLKLLGTPSGFSLNIRSSESGWPYAEDIVPQLFSDHGAIVFLAGEIRYMQDTYNRVALLDISQNAKMILELHTAGSILNRARIRREAQEVGKPLKIPPLIDLSDLKKSYPSKLCP